MQGYLARNKQPHPSPLGHHVTLGIVLLHGPREGGVSFMSEVLLYQRSLDDFETSRCRDLPPESFIRIPHPTSHTLHPAPSILQTLHPSPNTLNRAHPTTQTLHPQPGIYVLNLGIGFLSPAADPASDGVNS